jgi:hypothetical protein
VVKIIPSCRDGMWSYVIIVAGYTSGMGRRVKGMNIRMFLYGSYTFPQEMEWKKRRDEIMNGQRLTKAATTLPDGRRASTMPRRQESVIWLITRPTRNKFTITNDQIFRILVEVEKQGGLKEHALRINRIMEEIVQEHEKWLAKKRYTKTTLRTMKHSCSDTRRMSTRKRWAER